MNTPLLIPMEPHPQFAQFWAAYPRRVAPFAAKRAFLKAIRKTTLETMMAAICQQKQSAQWKQGFIPHPATWLNNGRWLDEVMPTPPAQVQKETQTIEARMRAIRANYGGMQTWADDDKKEYQSLRLKLSALRAPLVER